MAELYHPTVLPGSVAEGAIGNIADYFYDHGELDVQHFEGFLKQQILDAGADPITAKAASRTMAVLAEKNPENAQTIAETIAATTLTDPAFISDKARQSVLQSVSSKADLDKLSVDERKALAFTHASKALDDAGITDVQSKESLKARISEYIDQGASPDVAAAASVAPLAADGVPKAESLSIFGYLTALVHKAADYTFDSFEYMQVGDSAIHTHMSNVRYELGDNDYTIDTTETVKTTATTTNRVHPAIAIGEYPGNYKAINGFSGSLHLARYKYGGHWTSGGVLATTVALGLRIYTAGIDTDLVAKNYAITDLGGVDNRKTLIDIFLNKFTSIRSAMTKM